MESQYIFQRIEKKYHLTQEKKDAFLAAVGDRIHPDAFGLDTIHNLYFDTPEYELIRRSMEKPRYKEKLRLRGYGNLQEDSRVYLELKKKYKGIVYKRRISMTKMQGDLFLAQGILPDPQTQISREIAYFMEFYRPKPKVYLAYDRTAYVCGSDKTLRITIDEKIRSRFEHLRLEDDSGCTLLDPDLYLMEIKVPSAYPLWLVEILSDLKIYPASFSKYGSVYENNF